MACSNSSDIPAMEAQIKILQLQLEITKLRSTAPASGITGMNNTNADFYAAAVAMEKPKAQSYNTTKMIQLGKPISTSTTDYAQGKSMATPLQTESGKESSIPLKANILPKDMILSTGQPATQDSSSLPKGKNSKTKSKKKIAKTPVIEETQLSLRPEKPEYSDRRWKPSSQKPVSIFQLDILNLLFQHIKSPDIIRKVEKEFARQNQLNQTQKIHQINWPITQISFKPEINQEIKIDETLPLDFSVFKTKIFPSFFRKYEKSKTIEKEIYQNFNFKSFQNLFSKLAHDKSLEEKMSLEKLDFASLTKEVGYNPYYLAVFKIKDRINVDMFSELFNAGFISEIFLNKQTMAMIQATSIPGAVKEFVNFISDENDEDQFIKIFTACPSYEWWNWSTYGEVVHDIPTMNCPIWIIMEMSSTSKFKLTRPKVNLVRDFTFSRRAAGLQIITQVINSPEHYIWKDDKAIQLMAMHSKRRSSIFKFLQPSGFLNSQMLEIDEDDNHNYYSDNDESGNQLFDTKELVIKADSADKAKDASTSTKASNNVPTLNTEQATHNVDPDSPTKAKAKDKAKAKVEGI